MAWCAASQPHHMARGPLLYSREQEQEQDNSVGSSFLERRRQPLAAWKIFTFGWMYPCTEENLDHQSITQGLQYLDLPRLIQNTNGRGPNQTASFRKSNRTIQYDTNDPLTSEGQS
jgi:hypothetical protein